MSESFDCISDCSEFSKKSRAPDHTTNTNKKFKISENDTKIQDAKCICIANKYNDLDMCRECTLSLDKNYNLEDDECRFNGWRRLKIVNTKFCEFFDFLQESDSSEKDKNIWDLVCDYNKISPDETHKILAYIGKNFEKLIEDEIKFRQKFEKNSTWKKMLMHSRELCDKCSTTIFNGHMACGSCGFIVCIDCFELRSRNLKLNDKIRSNRDQYSWLHCYKYNFELKKIIKKAHSPSDMLYVQFIPSQILNKIYFIYKNRMASINKTGHTSQLKSSYLTLDSFTQNSLVDDEILTDIFEKEWHSKRPIVVKNLHKSLNEKLWTPDSFSSEFGHLEINLVNCRNNRIVPKVLLKKFWSGFSNLEERPCDHKGRKMVLKLKDWPSSDDFKHFLPSRYEDLMKNLPVKKFTQRNGTYNLVSYLPDFFCLPDLGPKLYIAYSSAETPREGTTNLHVDISDAVNLMVYVSDLDTNSEPNDLSEKKMLKVLKDSNCLQEHIDRYLNNEKPGALWHIFKPNDADNIRTFLSLRDIKREKEIVNGNDPIHDQTNYLNKKMIEDLKSEYNVEVFTIVQFLGDAIFIPSGAPHQVRNLSSCIKVAGDFVTPHGITDCLLLTEQIRELSENHINHEDKLQVKNIIYHGVKMCLSVLNENDNRPKELH
uniref:Lysine-specific demethylase 3A n=1 Tax=Brachionus koreanus TaxID=1199090 RepID=A0A4Y6EQZ3_9BILA|nr:lysine-specific demethylase 3A [Brachionus koreanus]